MERYLEWDARIERVALWTATMFTPIRPWCEAGSCRAHGEFWASFCVPGLRAGYVATVKGALCHIHALDFARKHNLEIPRVDG
jgi:hypothetical protein